MNNNSNGPLMFIETYKDEINEDKIYKYDSRKIKKVLNDRDSLLDNGISVDNIKIYKYQDKLIIPYKTDTKNIYGIIISKFENNIVKDVVIDLNESCKFEIFKQ